jgi:capsid portal protein
MADTNNILSIELAQIKLPDTHERIISNCKYVRYGDDNNFNIFLENLRDNAPLHNAILTSKLEQAYGEGVVLDNEKNIAARLFTAKVNDFNDMNDIYYRCLQDLQLFGGFYIEVIWDNGGKVAELYHLPFGKVRAGRKDEETRQIKEYFYCEDWVRQYQLGYTPIPVFNLDNRIGRQIYAYKNYISGREYYPMPDYVASLPYIALEKEIANYGLSEIRNGFGGSNMISFVSGVPSEEEQQNIKERLTQQLTSSDNAGKLLVTFSPNGESAPIINSLQTTNAADKYLQLEKSVMQNILSGHRCTSPLLVGIRSENNGLGSNSNEIETAYELWFNTVIKPYQTKVLKVLNLLAMFTNNYDGWKYEATTISPITFTFSEATLTQILTKNELREKIGFDPIQEVEVINETNE